MLLPGHPPSTVTAATLSHLEGGLYPDLLPHATRSEPHRHPLGFDVPWNPLGWAELGWLLPGPWLSLCRLTSPSRPRVLCTTTDSA